MHKDLISSSVTTESRIDPAYSTFPFASILLPFLSYSATPSQVYTLNISNTWKFLIILQSIRITTSLTITSYVSIRLSYLASYSNFLWSWASELNPKSTETFLCLKTSATFCSNFHFPKIGFHGLSLQLLFFHRLIVTLY